MKNRRKTMLKKNMKCAKNPAGAFPDCAHFQFCSKFSFFSKMKISFFLKMKFFKNEIFIFFENEIFQKWNFHFFLKMKFFKNEFVQWNERSNSFFFENESSRAHTEPDNIDSQILVSSFLQKDTFGSSVSDVIQDYVNYKILFHF